MGKGLSEKISKYESMLAAQHKVLRLKNSDLRSLKLRESESSQQAA